MDTREKIIADMRALKGTSRFGEVEPWMERLEALRPEAVDTPAAGEVGGSYPQFCVALDKQGDHVFSKFDGHTASYLYEAARVIRRLTAPQAAAAPVDGMVLVPREPTEAMLCAGYDADTEHAPGPLNMHRWKQVEAIYRAMIAAAPTREAAPVDGWDMTPGGTVKPDDDGLPGMWAQSDFTGGATDAKVPAPLDLPRTTVVEALKRLVEESVHPYDGGAYEDGEWPALDAARAAIANSEAAPEVGMARNREADRRRFPDEAFNRWLDDGISDGGHIVWDMVGDVAAAWQGWDSRADYEPRAAAGVPADSLRRFADEMNSLLDTMPKLASLSRFALMWTDGLDELIAEAARDTCRRNEAATNDRVVLDGSMSVEDAVQGVADLFPSADKQALRTLAALLTKPSAPRTA